MYKIGALILLLMWSCTHEYNISEDLDIQGHRGCRGDMPENTLPAFSYAITHHKVTTIEMDVCISKDLKVVVSHEPTFNDEITLAVEKNSQQNYNLYEMTYDKIKTFDVGLKEHPNFPNQKNVATYKPLFDEVITLAERLDPHIKYNIEIKRIKGNDGVYHPDYKRFADLVIDRIIKKNITQRTTLQCFDLETLKYIHDTYPRINLSLLVEHSRDIRWNISQLGFYPHTYSPYYKLLSREDINYCHNLGIKVVPWTLNVENEIRKFINLGCDGIISDYPGRVNQVYNNIKLSHAHN